LFFQFIHCLVVYQHGYVLWFLIYFI
jgi:hypothetical protein